MAIGNEYKCENISVYLNDFHKKFICVSLSGKWRSQPDTVEDKSDTNEDTDDKILIINALKWIAVEKFRRDSQSSCATFFVPSSKESSQR